jgi:Fe-S oxidoreductase
MDRCPVVQATGSSTYSPQSKMLQGWLIGRGLVPADPDVARAAYQCTGCLACHEACLHGVDVEQGLFSLRAELVGAGVSPFDLATFREDEAGLAAAQEVAVPSEYFVPEARAVAFAGCAALRKSPGVVGDLFSAMKAVGIEFVGASPDAAICCGYPLHAGGYSREFAAQAERVAAAMRRYRTVVVLSPCCLYTFRTLYAAAGVTSLPRMVLAIEMLAPLLERVERPPLQTEVAYHDSCFLGRHLELYDLPRNIIERATGRPPLELRRNRAEAPCCGAGGAWDTTAAHESARAAGNVLDMARDAGASVLVSGASRCGVHMSGVGHDVDVVDLISLIARWLGVARPARRTGSRPRGRSVSRGRSA